MVVRDVRLGFSQPASQPAGGRAGPRGGRVLTAVVGLELPDHRAQAFVPSLISFPGPLSRPQRVLGGVPEPNLRPPPRDWRHGLRIPQAEGRLAWTLRPSAAAGPGCRYAGTTWTLFAMLPGPQATAATSGASTV